MSNYLPEFKHALRCTTVGVIPDLRCIVKKQRPKTDCPKWYIEAIEQADLAYQTNEGWFITTLGRSVLDGTRYLA